MYKIFTESRKKRLLMRISFIYIFLLVSGIQLLTASSSRGQGLEDILVTIEMDENNLKSIIKKIELQTELTFAYLPAEIERYSGVSVSTGRQSVKSVLDQALVNTSLEYRYVENSVILLPKDSKKEAFFQSRKTAESMGPSLAAERNNKKSSSGKIVFLERRNTFELLNKRLVLNIFGKVVSSGGEPLIGVNILVKGTDKGVATDFNGEFELEDVDENSVLVISYIGYQTKEVPVNGKSELTITLLEDSQTLDEVVVTAFGITRESSSLPYSTQSIEARNLSEVRDPNNVINSLQGKVANALITQSSGGVGSEARMVLRGNSSIQGSNNALIVVDGVPNSKGVNINPEDIESMTILNGASAAALYGSEAGNGVVVIETKKGSKENISVNLNSSLTFERPFSLPEFQNVYGQGDLGMLDPQSGNSWGARMDGQQYQNVQGNSRSYSAQENNVKNFYNTGNNIYNSLSISGGSDRAQAYLSYTHNKVNGIIPNNEISSHNINLRLTTDVTEKLSLDGKVTYYTAGVGGMPRASEGNNAVLDIYQIPRNMSLSDAQMFETINDLGVQEPAPWPSTLSYRYQNPYWIVNYDRRSEDRDQIFGFLSAEYEITNWLDLTMRANLDKTNVVREQRTHQGTVSWATRPGGYYGKNINSNLIQWYDLIFKGNNDIGNSLNINYNFGAIYQDKLFNGDNLVSNGLNVANKFTHNFGTDPIVSSNTSQIQTQSLFGLLNISYENKFYLEASFRNDWDSRLPSPHSYQYYSVGGSTILSKYLSLPEAISFLKANISYAEVGNGGQFGLLTNTYEYDAGVSNGYIARTSTYSIPDLKPEIIKSKEVGLEARFLDNRFSFQFTYYRSNSINQLLTINMPAATGYEERYINAGNIQNSGLEFVLSAQPIVNNDFSWRIDFNAAFNRNKIIELAEELDVVYQGSFVDWGGRPQIAVGGSYGDIVATKWARDSQGRYLVNDRGTPITSGAVGEQPSVIGNFNPKATMGLSNSFSFKNFGLRILTDGRVGGIIISGTEQNLAFSGITESTLPFRDGGWNLGGVNTEGEAVNAEITAQDFWQVVSQKRSGTGEFFTYDATNFRIREVSLSYSLPVQNVEAISSVKFSLVGRNILWLYRGKSMLDIPGIGKRRMWMDPDISLGHLNSFQGIEYGMPSTRSIGLNVNLTF